MGLIRSIIDIYVFVLIADVILSYLPQFRHYQWAYWIRRAADFTCGPIRRMMPQDLPFDFSPLIVILLLNLLQAMW